jgi:alpha-D-xyloside xylohydrolase
MVAAAVNMGVSGAPTWGGDIGGFTCNADGGAAADGELWTRWIQQGALTPIMQDQNACVFSKDHVAKASIWTSPDAKEAWRTYARLHTRLFPYLYSYAHAAAQTGAPLVRHLFLEHPERVELASVADEYYFGEGLLVAPVIERGARKRAVVFPAGKFADWDDGTVHSAGTATVAAPLAKLPLFLRDGYLVPMLDASIDTLMPEDNTAVTGPGDVAGVYDVAGFLGDATAATFTLFDGGTLSVTRSGAPDFSALGSPTSETAFAACTATCWRTSTRGDVTRVQVSHAGGALAVGGLMLRADAGRRIRWDLFLQ